MKNTDMAHEGERVSLALLALFRALYIFHAAVTQPASEVTTCVEVKVGFSGF